MARVSGQSVRSHAYPKLPRASFGFKLLFSERVSRDIAASDFAWWEGSWKVISRFVVPLGERKLTVAELASSQAGSSKTFVRKRETPKQVGFPWAAF